MTAQDRQYMVDVDDANLTSFLAWHRDATDRGILRNMTWYSQLKMAWMAARNSQRTPELAPSSDVLPPAPKLSVGPGERARLIEPGGPYELAELVKASRQRRMAAGLPADPSPPRDWPVEWGKKAAEPASFPNQQPWQPPAGRQQVFEQEPYLVPESPPGPHRTIDPDPFERARFTGPQQAAMDSLYPLPARDKAVGEAVQRATPVVWDGELPKAPETTPLRVLPDNFELVEQVKWRDMPTRGPVEGV